MMKVSLNLSRRYCPNWAGWEVVREIITNAIDAGEGWKLRHSKGRIAVTSVQDVDVLARLLVVGEGTKSPNGTTIGQFGEGLKIAALAATRMGLNMAITSGISRISFEFGSSLGADDVLHAVVEKGAYIEGVAISIDTPPDVSKEQLDEWIRPTMKHGPSPAYGKDGAIYVKGIRVCSSPLATRFHWRLDSVEVNRDRSVADYSSVVGAVMHWLDDGAHGASIQRCILGQMDDDLISKALNWKSYFSCPTATQIDSARQLWSEFHGSQAVAVMAHQPEMAEIARRSGLEPVIMPKETESLLRAWMIPMASSLSKEIAWEGRAVTDDVDSAVASLKRLAAKLTGVPGHNIRVGLHIRRQVLGQALFGDRTIWLSEELFAGGVTPRLLQVYVHEMAHLMAGAEDATVQFEDALDALAGQLAWMVMQ